MTTFHYSVPESAPSSPWEGLSDQARTSLASLAVGPSPANQLLGGPATGNGMEVLSQEVRGWAEQEFNTLGWTPNIGKLKHWQRFDNELGQAVPNNLESLSQVSPNLGPTLVRLYEAKKDLLASGETTPTGENIGDTMHLLVVPWEAFYNHMTDIKEWVKQMRAIQGITKDDFFNDDLVKAITQNQALYRDLSAQGKAVQVGQYLQNKIDTDGPFGVILAQTSDQAGLKSIVEGPEAKRSPDAMTQRGETHFEIAGQAVDGMGVYEWLALTFQEDPTKLSSTDVSWLLANRISINNTPYVPYGLWIDSQVRSNLSKCDVQDGHVRARLAVM
jgi:hypothetical protein